MPRAHHASLKIAAEQSEKSSKKEPDVIIMAEAIVGRLMARLLALEQLRSGTETKDPKKYDLLSVTHPLDLTLPCLSVSVGPPPRSDAFSPLLCLGIASLACK